MSALEAVDAVTIFDEDTPLELITAIRPDVLVKGGDYRPEEVVGRAEVEAAGRPAGARPAFRRSFDQRHGPPSVGTRANSTQWGIGPCAPLVASRADGTALEHSRVARLSEPGARSHVSRF